MTAPSAAGSKTTTAASNQGRAAGRADRPVVGRQFGQAGHLLGAPGEQRHAGKRGGQAPGDRGKQVVTAGQVRALTGENRGKLRLVEDGERAAGDDGQPGSVCTSPGVTAAAGSLGSQR